MSRGRILTVAFLLSVVLASGAHAARPVKIAASANPWTIVGNPLRISGTVSPSTAGLQVTLQEKNLYGGWMTLDAMPVNASGAFAFTAKPNRLGTKSFRVVTAKGSAFSGASTTVPVRVFQWSYLGDVFAGIPPLAGNTDFDPVSIAKVEYDHPVALDAGCFNQWDGSAWIDYILNRQYQQFTATVGIVDGVASNSTASFKVVGGDGKVFAAGQLTAGVVQKVNVSVAGEYRLRLWINVPDTLHTGGCSSTFTQVAFGDAQLLGP